MSTAAQIRFAYAIALQQGGEGLAQHVTSLQLALRSTTGDRAIRNAELLHLILARCPAVKAMALIRIREGVHGTKVDYDTAPQADIDALSSIVSAPQHLHDLTLDTFWLRPDQCPIIVTEEVQTTQGPSPSSDGRRLIFPRQLTDQLARLRSLSYKDNDGFGWNAVVRCLGPRLRFLRLSIPKPVTFHLEVLAKASPHLTTFLLETTKSARLSDAEVSHFLQSGGRSLKTLAISHITEAAAVNTAAPQQTRPLASIASLTKHCQQLEELELGKGVMLTTEDLETMTESSSPPLRVLSLQSVAPITYMRHSPLAHSERLLSALVRSRASSLQVISMSKSVILADDGFLHACTQLAKLRRINVKLAPFVRDVSIEALYSAHPNLLSNFSLPVLKMLQSHHDEYSICPTCLVQGKEAAFDEECTHEDTCYDVQQKSLDFFVWPQAHAHGYCTSCFLPLQLCELAEKERGECTYRTEMRALLAFYSPETEGWRKLTSEGVPTYWSILEPHLARASSYVSNFY